MQLQGRVSAPCLPIFPHRTQTDLRWPFHEFCSVQLGEQSLHRLAHLSLWCRIPHGLRVTERSLHDRCCHLNVDSAPKEQAVAVSAPTAYFCPNCPSVTPLKWHNLPPWSSVCKCVLFRSAESNSPHSSGRTWRVSSADQPCSYLQLAIGCSLK